MAREIWRVVGMVSAEYWKGVVLEKGKLGNSILKLKQFFFRAVNQIQGFSQVRQTLYY